MSNQSPVSGRQSPVTGNRNPETGHQFSRQYPIAKEGWPFVGIALALSILGFVWHPIVGGLLLVLVAFNLYFFRNPKRISPQNPDFIVSPADGKILYVEKVIESRFLKKEVLKLSIFMSPLNVHVNRIPVTGQIKQISYNKGKFLTAFSEKASLDNEQNALIIENDKKEEILFIQIAGWLARRIVCYAKPGESWKQGDVFGLIRYGSRMDVYLPLGYLAEVKVGDKVKAGESVLARKN